ncbi:HAD family hydrolase [uncultured Sphaerochaeta sp.]|uniref:HAD family hydrolase n=1 Tax=uncultured Sphaerochaeta sp. TaxID=886478 RepID=UPI002A0A578C|nr:HAD family hydrolase [uncultured Sphaerochaeta sp.]
MPKSTLIAFDFDGTFYPIAPYDSEQLLMLKCAASKGLLNRTRAKRAVIKDMKGCSDWQTFTDDYRLHTRSFHQELIDSVVDELIKAVKDEQFELLEELHGVADLAIISCGTENLIHAFLERKNIADLFMGVWGKQFHFIEGSSSSMEIHVHGAQDKKRLLQELRQGYGQTIAIGDGPTDIPMLKSANLGLLVDWTGKKESPYPFKSFSSFKEACKEALLSIKKA